MKFSTLESSLATGGATAITPDFSIYTSAMEADPEQEHVVHMVGSSTERDLHGDTMSISALTDMTLVKPGQSTWLNHHYNLPDDLFGSLTKSPSLTLEAGIADIHIVSDVETSNPAALRTFEYIKKGRRTGCSIGCMVTEFEIDEENDDGHSWWPPIIILHVLVLEFSVVGIPANQRCWCETATKGLFERMVSEGKGDQALKLAPAVKGLYSRAFADRLKSIENDALRRDLERIEVRQVPTRRVEWVPNERTFVMNQKGIYRPLERSEVATFMTKSTESPLPSVLAKESTAGTPAVETKSLPEIEKGASGKTAWPLADKDVSWDDASAKKNIKEYAGGDDALDWGKVHSCCFWFDPEKADTWDGCKLFFVDENDGSMKAIPHGIYACAESIQGARSPLKIPEDDIPAVKKKIEVYYHKMDEKAPWEDKEDDKSMEPEKEIGTQTVTQLFDTTATSAPKDTPVPAAVLAAVQEAEERYDEEHEISFVVPNTDPLDVQLYNALAAKFGMPALTLDASGKIVIQKTELAISSETIQDILLKALDIIKSGTEFSKENRDALQQLHNDLVNMCMSSFHPCKEMETAASDKNDPDHDGDAAYDNDGDGDGAANYIPAKAIAPSLTALQEQVTLLTEALSAHALDPATLKSLKSQAEAVSRKFEAIAGQLKATKEDLSKLRSLPLGQPTRLTRGIQGDGVATYQDFLGLTTVKELSMNDNERTWTLAEALKSTSIILKQVDGNALRYRHWPEGVGGSIEKGVRPPLTGDQRSFMRPWEAVDYADGKEADVPCYDDPGGILP